MRLAVSLPVDDIRGEKFRLGFFPKPYYPTPMTKENIVSMDREAFKRRLGELAAQQELQDAPAFADAVYTAMSRHGLDETRFRNAFGLTAGAVERWTQMKNLPQPSVRPRIIQWIIEQLQ